MQVIELTMHKSEFMHCSSSLLALHQSNLKIGFVLLACCLPGRQLTAVLKIQSPAPWDRDGRAAAVLVQTCGKWKKPAKLPIENEISKRLLLLKHRSCCWSERNHLGELKQHAAKQRQEQRRAAASTLQIKIKTDEIWSNQTEFPSWDVQHHTPSIQSETAPKRLRF